MKTNPFSMVYDTLWAMVERNPQLSRILPPGNRIKFGEEVDYKQAISTADLPQLMLLVNGGKVNIRDSSSTCRVWKNYLFIIQTGSLQIAPVLDEISWELFRSLVDYDRVLCELVWPNENCHFVDQATTIDITEGLDAGDERVPIFGWTALWELEVSMHFNTSDLRINTEEFDDA